jgi:integrase
VRRRGFKTRAEAQAALDALRVAARAGVVPASTRQTLGRFLTDEWLPAVRMTVEPSTWASYSRYLRLHVLPRIGHLQLTRLDAGVLNRFYADLLEGGRRDGKPGGLSPRSVRYIHSILGRALREAVAWGLLNRNVVTSAQPPSARAARPKEMRTWGGSTLARFLELTRDHEHHAAWHFLATTGCRRGEALGLRWKDVDLAKGLVSIRQTLAVIEHEVVIRPTTKSGRSRVVQLDSGTVALLRSRRSLGLRSHLERGAGVDDDLVFARLDGRLLQPEHVSRAFERAVRRLGLPIIRLHDLRHTWATLALAAGVDVKVVSERLGHASATITWDIYQHVTPSMASDAAQVVADLIFGPSL